MALYKKALEGDVRAAETVLAVAGERQTLKPIRLPDMSSTADLPKVTGGILKAVADGKLAPDDALKLASIAAAHGKALELADLEKRIAELENLR